MKPVTDAGRRSAFGVSYTLDHVSSDKADEFLKKFLEEVIEPNRLECLAPGEGSEWDFRAASLRYKQPKPAQRNAVVAWLRSRKEVTRFEVEELD